jgi:hypothetical protein
MIRLSNYSATRFTGWRRFTTDQALPEAGWLGGHRFVLGRRIGLDARIIDLHVTLAPGQVLELDPATAVSEPFRIGPIPANPVEFFGIPRLNWANMKLLGAQPDGAAYLAHFRAIDRDMFCVDLWLWWYPDQPGWCQGEVVVTASNVSIPDLGAATPGRQLIFGDWATTLPAATFGDGQARSLPVFFMWYRHKPDYQSFGAVVQCAISANGIAKLWPDGNPVLTAGRDPLAWSRANWGEATACVDRWERPVGLGVNQRSGDTGAQADQVFVGAECMGPKGLGAETVLYLTALAQSRRPCHHLEADGSPLDLDRHPNLRLWDGRPHPSLSVSPDQLGKPRALTEAEANGWWGPDVEHWLINTLAIAARLTGSPALQWQLGHEARVYLKQEANSPYFFASRAVGWEGIGVVHLWSTLEDRVLAERVRDAYVARLNGVLMPKMVGAGPWDVRTDDPRLGTGRWAIEWQESLGAYGFDLVGRVLGQPQACDRALAGALRILDEAWKQVDGVWLCAPVRPLDQTDGPVDLQKARQWVHEDAGVPMPETDAVAVFDGSFTRFGMPLAVDVVLRYQPNNERALSIWSQIAPDGGQWIPPR